MTIDYLRRQLTLAKENTYLMNENPLTQTDVVNKPEAIHTSKKQFIEPEISTPVDVLEATTFFQAVTSGSTN